MTVCANRPEGFGPHSSIHPSVPTTCFDETILIPLPTWIYLICLVLFVLPRSHVRRSTFKTPSSRSTKALAISYYVLLVCMIAMQSLQLARLARAELGIGLLPFTYVGIIGAGAVQYLTESAWARGVTAGYWAFLAIMMGVTVAALKDEEGPYNRLGTQFNYPLGDEVTDLSVMVGVAIVLAAIQVMMIFLRRSAKARGGEPK